MSDEQEPTYMTEAPWDDFRNAGMAWFVNRILHVFGWSIVFECEEGGRDARVIRAYPARTNVLGFSEETDRARKADVLAEIRR